jgi:ABC-2 type transport system ATP-binding protein
VWDIVRGIAAGGTTVLLTTQYLEEADRLAERLAVIDNGRVIAEGTSRELKARVGANALQVRLADAAHKDLAQAVITGILGDGIIPQTDATTVSAQLPDTAEAEVVLAALRQSGVQVAEFSVGAPSLDDVFFALTGHAAEPQAKAAEVSA